MNIKILNKVIIIVLLGCIISCNNIKRVTYTSDYEYAEETYEVYYGHIINEATQKEKDEALKHIGKNNVAFFIMSYVEDSITITINDKEYFSDNLIVLDSSTFGYQSFKYSLKKGKNPVVKIYSRKTKTKIEFVLDTRYPSILCMNTKYGNNWSFSYNYKWIYLY